jgi:hypothetical protein
LARLNILQGTLRGKLGKITGCVWKGKPVIRAAIYSKTPSNMLQTASVRAFEKLNRVASAIARVGFAHTGLSAKNMHKHNAVASWLKPSIRNHIFEPQNLSAIIPLSDNVKLSRFIFNYSTNECIVSFQLSPDYVPLPNSYLHFVVFDDLANTYYSQCDIVRNFTTNFFIDTFGLQVYSVLAFVSEPYKNKRVCKNLIYKKGAGMRYSLEEQLTGDIWLDGRPIYQRTFMSNDHVFVVNTSNVIRFPAPGVSALLKAEINTIDNDSNTRFRTGAVIGQISAEPQDVSATCTFNYTFDGQTLNSGITCRHQTVVSNMNNAIIYVTFFYTKQSDQPVVDG